MARTRSAAGGEDGRCPTLRLIMNKGPLEGQISDYKPGTRVQIGRIARGNTMAIKDAGISSKHFVIQVNPTSDGVVRSWTITDLGSSNGTFLNGLQLVQLEPVVLSDGDVVKIGEQTSIEVKFEANGDENGVSSGNMRRNARRGRPAVVELGIIDENSEIGLGDNCVNNLGPKSVNENSELGVPVLKETVRGRRTVNRGSKNAGEIEMKVENVEKASLRRTRSSKKEVKLEISLPGLDEDNENSVVAEAEVSQGRNVSQRGSRSSEKNLSMVEDLNADEHKDLGPSEVKGEQRVRLRRTRSSRKEEQIGEEAGIDLRVTEGKRTRKGGARGRKKVPAEIPEEKEANLENEICAEEERGSKDGVEELAEKVNSGREVLAELASTSGVKENTTNIGNGAEMVADLEKMTIGEWFEEASIDLRVTEGKRTRKGGARGRKKVPAEIPEEKEANLENEICAEEERGSKDGVEELAEKVNSGREVLAELASTSGVKENTTNIGNGAEMVADLEKMTMGEWFDFLEVFLPQQIIDATEEMISEMRQKAERLHVYMLQQNKG